MVFPIHDHPTRLEAFAAPVPLFPVLGTAGSGWFNGLVLLGKSTGFSWSFPMKYMVYYGAFLFQCSLKPIHGLVVEKSF